MNLFIKKIYEFFFLLNHYEWIFYKEFTSNLIIFFSIGIHWTILVIHNQNQRHHFNIQKYHNHCNHHSHLHPHCLILLLLHHQNKTHDFQLPAIFLQCFLLQISWFACIYSQVKIIDIEILFYSWKRRKISFKALRVLKSEPSFSIPLSVISGQLFWLEREKYYDFLYLLKSRETRFNEIFAFKASLNWWIDSSPIKHGLSSLPIRQIKSQSLLSKYQLNLCQRAMWAEGLRKVLHFDFGKGIPLWKIQMNLFETKHIFQAFFHIEDSRIDKIWTSTMRVNKMKKFTLINKDGEFVRKLKSSRLFQREIAHYRKYFGSC